MNFKKIFVAGVAFFIVGVSAILIATRMDSSVFTDRIGDIDGMEDDMSLANAQKNEMLFKEPITELDIEADSDQIEIREAKDAENPRMIYYDAKISLEKGKLSVVISPENKLFRFAWRETNRKTEIILPKGTRLKSHKIAIDAGKVTVENIPSEKLQIQVGAGLVELRRCDVKEANLLCDAGKIEWTESVLEKMDASVAVGKISFQGDLIGPSKWRADAGTIEVDTTLGQANYQITKDVSMGKIDIEGVSEASGEYSQIFPMTVQVDVGSAQLHFGEKGIED